MAAKLSKKLGRHKPSILEQHAIQTLMLKKIVQTGKEQDCWEGVTKRRNYLYWKAKHRESWEKRVNAAIAQFHNHEILADPNLKKMVIKALVEKIKNGDMTPAELLKVLQFLPDIAE